MIVQYYSVKISETAECYPGAIVTNDDDVCIGFVYAVDNDCHRAEFVLFEPSDLPLDPASVEVFQVDGVGVGGMFEETIRNAAPHIKQAWYELINHRLG